MVASVKLVNFIFLLEMIFMRIVIYVGSMLSTCMMNDEFSQRSDPRLNPIIVIVLLVDQRMHHCLYCWCQVSDWFNLVNLLLLLFDTAEQTIDRPLNLVKIKYY